MITDGVSTGSLEQWALCGYFKSTAAIKAGYCVSMDSSGTIATSATGTLQMVIGVAAEDIPSGAVGRVIVFGFCDTLVTADTILAPADNGTQDQCLIVIDGGGVEGRAVGEIYDAFALGNTIVGKNLGGSSSTTAYGWIAPASGTFAKDVA